ncbi:MAG: imidazole glycerol phosphate synthase subunit HisF [Candidatus Tectomicrobia bacterium]|uniref:imidazole glycerol-phosphate synthase n=1 Tax=Tectimicrobiota bacterium TaxID=2528274 RepID=A0A932HUQ4_UNCTE|nr:imidazole glycerol phosphate synthase subunit HisF [Candidatus Tectomicrobia bacterium]
MLKKRIIGCLIVRDGIVVQSINFRSYLPVGRPKIAVEYLNRWSIDEIAVLDITAGRNGDGPNVRLVKEVSDRCFVPLTAGGGIRSLRHVEMLIQGGADKISVNTAALETPELITEVANAFGSQSVIVSIDAVSDGRGGHRVWSFRERRALDATPVEHARRAEGRGAGEILLNSVDRDGSKAGYDIGLVGELASKVGIPVIALGGAGHPRHFAEVFQKTAAAAAAAANYFHFTEHSVITTKSFLERDGLGVRLDGEVNYQDSGFARTGRIRKKDDLVLDELRFVPVEPDEL